MVKKLTLFELHMDSPRFGTNEYADDYDDYDEEYELVEDESEHSSGDDDGRRRPPVGRLILASIALSIAASLVARRLVGGDDEADVFEFEDEAEEQPIEVTQ